MGVDKKARALAGMALVVGLVVAGLLVHHLYVGHPASDRASSERQVPSPYADKMDRVEKRLRELHEQEKFDNLSRRIDCLDARTERIC